MIRVSGEAAAELARRVCPGLVFEGGWRAQLVELLSAAGEPMDRAVAIPYPRPRSYTGEDMLELMVHGSSFLVDAVVEACVAAGARPAVPGEFTRRAVANGKMDLLQAEAVADLVEAETEWQLRAARRQLEGGLSEPLGAIREDLILLKSELEAVIDFSDQGVILDESKWALRHGRVVARLDQLLASASLGERVRDGVRVMLVGAPNSGKSTLFNHLLREERAIVSPHPGTTRDVIEAEVEVGGLKVVLVDGAGIHDGGGAIEREGVRRARAAAAEADAVLVLWPADVATAPVQPEAGDTLLVRSKADLADDSAGCEQEGWLPVSCVTGQGLDRLRQRLLETVVGGRGELEGAPSIGRRHRHCLDKAAAALTRCDWSRPELAAEDVGLALELLGELTGEVQVEDVLEQIFGQFCIGK